MTFLLTSCLGPKRKEIEATLWLNNAPLPAYLCILHSELRDYGFYRKLEDGRIEFVSFCQAEAQRWIAIHESDLKRLLDKYVPKTNGEFEQ